MSLVHVREERGMQSNPRNVCGAAVSTLPDCDWSDVGCDGLRITFRASEDGNVCRCGHRECPDYGKAFHLHLIRVKKEGGISPSPTLSPW